MLASWRSSRTRSRCVLRRGRGARGAGAAGRPLVVGGDPKGRGDVATANDVARRFGIHSAMSCAEAPRRCPHAVFLRPRHSLYREYSQRRLVRRARGLPDGRADGDRRGLPRPGRGRRRVPPRAGAWPRRCRRPCAGRRACRARSASRPRRWSRRSRRPAQAGRAHGRAGRARRPRSSRRSTCGSSRASGRGPRNASQGRGRPPSAALAALEDERLRAAPAREGRRAAPRPGAGNRPTPARDARSSDLDLARRRPSSGTSPTVRRSMRRCAAWPRARRAPPAKRQVGADGHHKGALRDFSIRSRSTTGRHRRPRADRRARLRPARPRAHRPAGRAAARGRRPLGPLGFSAAAAGTSTSFLQRLTLKNRFNLPITSGMYARRPQARADPDRRRPGSDPHPSRPPARGARLRLHHRRKRRRRPPRAQGEPRSRSSSAT